MNDDIIRLKERERERKEKKRKISFKESYIKSKQSWRERCPLKAIGELLSKDFIHSKIHSKFVTFTFLFFFFLLLLYRKRYFNFAFNTLNFLFLFL